MKRKTVRNAERAAQRMVPKPGTQSSYGRKVARGQQMYGPGCCAHSVSNSQIEHAREAARKRGHFREAGIFNRFD